MPPPFVPADERGREQPLGEPRERPAPPPVPVGPVRAVAGAGLAVAGVALGIGALLVVTGGDDKGSPAVVSPPIASQGVTSPSPTASPTARATPQPSGVSPAPSASAVVPPAPTPAPTPTAAQAPIVPVSVLNNSRISGLADRSAARFRAGGWPVRTTGNYSGGTIAQTTVYYPPGQQASAERFAKQFGIPRVRPRFSGIPTSGMTVIVTRDYA